MNVIPSDTPAELRRWWLADDESMPDLLATIVSSLAGQLGLYLQQRMWSRRLYGNQPPLAWWMTSAQIPMPTPAARGRFRRNVTKLACDTVQARVAKSKPDTMWLTSGGDYRQRRRAQSLTRFCRGVKDENDIHALMQSAFLQAEIDGSAYLEVFERHRKIRIEPVNADEIWVDEQACQGREPGAMFRVRNVDRLELAEMFPEKRDAIMGAASITGDDLAVASPGMLADVVQVCEAWRLPVNADRSDGVHVIAIKEAILLREPWKRTRFPFVHIRWTRRPNAWYGQSLCEEEEPVQLQINALCRAIQEAHDTIGGTKLWIKTGSNTNPNELNDEIGAVIESDEQPAYITPQMVAPEVYQWLQQLKNDAMETARLTLSSAQGANPLGPGASGAALREMQYIEGDGFSIVQQEFERAYMQCDRLIVDVAMEMKERGIKLAVKSPREHGRGYDTIHLEDIWMDDLSSFILQLFPVSSLPQSPAARMATVQEWSQAGWLNPRQARRLMNLPDVDSVFSLQNAVEERICDALDMVIDEGEYEPPDGFLDLGLALEIGIEYWNLYVPDGLEPAKRAMLSTWLSQVQMLQAKAMPPPMAPALPPQAGPQPQPTSPLVQNVPGVQA